MRQSKRKYERPTRPYDKQRIEKEREIVKNFGLRRKKEIWISEGLLRKYRRLARALATSHDEESEKILLEKMIRFGMLKEGSDLDDVLGLTVENFLGRRLQTVVFKKGLAGSIKQARQIIVHGHVTISGRKVTYPSYLVPKAEEDLIKVRIPIATKVVKNATAKPESES